MLLLFGHSENVQKILQPINNDSILTLIRLIDFPT